MSERKRIWSSGGKYENKMEVKEEEEEEELKKEDGGLYIYMQIL